LIIPEHKRADLGDLFAAALLERDPSASTEQLDLSSRQGPAGPFADAADRGRG